jgi:signal transduction histidine kinase
MPQKRPSPPLWRPASSPTSVTTPQEQEREVLRQASAALYGRVVTLWEVSPATDVAPVVSSVNNPPRAATKLDLDATLRRWGAPIIQGSRWVGCRLDDGRALRGHWCVAPVRARPAGPPPTGIERRSRERLILELAGLCVGSIDAGDAVKRRLPPAEQLWELARQPSVIAHEVGNPLAVALGNLDLSIDAVREATSLDPAFRSAVLDDLANVAQGIEQAADYLRSIQVRPFGSSGRIARFDVTPVLRSCVTLERPLARKHGVPLKWQTSVESAFLFGDSNALYQVITNLLRNAVDASRGREAPVMVTMDQAGATLTLTIRDRGVGIAPENRDRIFEAGFTTKQSGAGTGIGLAVVKEITHNMFGGTVTVDSEPGAGSTFTLTLPIPPQRSGEGRR